MRRATSPTTASRLPGTDRKIQWPPTRRARARRLIAAWKFLCSAANPHYIFCHSEERMRRGTCCLPARREKQVSRFARNDKQTFRNYYGRQITTAKPDESGD